MCADSCSWKSFPYYEFEPRKARFMGITYTLLGFEDDSSSNSGHRRKRVRIANTSEAYLIPHSGETDNNSSDCSDDSWDTDSDNRVLAFLDPGEHVLLPEQPTHLRRARSIRRRPRPSDEMPLVFSADSLEYRPPRRIHGILRSSRLSSFHDDSEPSRAQTNLNTFTNAVTNYESALDSDDAAPPMENSLETLRNTLHNLTVDVNSHAQILRLRSNSRSSRQSRVFSPPPRSVSPVELVSHVRFEHDENQEHDQEGSNGDDDDDDADDDDDDNEERISDHEEEMYQDLEVFLNSVENSDVPSRASLLQAMTDLDYIIGREDDRSRQITLRLARLMMRLYDEHVFLMDHVPMARIRRVDSMRALNAARGNPEPPLFARSRIPIRRTAPEDLPISMPNTEAAANTLDNCISSSDSEHASDVIESEDGPSEGERLRELVARAVEQRKEGENADGNGRKRGLEEGDLPDSKRGRGGC